MRCYVCLSHYAGPLGLCPDCIMILYPHGMTPYVTRDRRRAAPPPTVASSLLVPAP